MITTGKNSKIATVKGIQYPCKNRKKEQSPAMVCEYVLTIYPHAYPDSLWISTISDVSGYSMRFVIRVNAKRNRNKMFADTNESRYVWTGPK